MTTPLGVPNLPLGALTVETLADKLQDQTQGAMRDRARDRMPVIFDNSSGGDIASLLYDGQAHQRLHRGHENGTVFLCVFVIQRDGVLGHDYFSS